MRLWIFSDLHFDFTPWAPPEPRPVHDAIVIAGDLTTGLAAGIAWIAAEGLNERPVILVAGNHEFFEGTRDGGLREGRAAAARHANIHLLQDEAVEIAGVRFLGATLWTDYALNGKGFVAADMAAARRGVNDHNAIAIEAQGGRNWMPEDARAEHIASRVWLDRALAEPAAGPRVVVTHHAPSRRSMAPRFAGNPLNAAFYSALDPLVAKADLWIHGHSHAACDYRVGDARVISNPRGYVAGRRVEQTGFDPTLVIEVAAAARPLETAS